MRRGLHRPTFFDASRRVIAFVAAHRMNGFGWLTSAPRMVLSHCNFQLRSFIINRRLVREFQQAVSPGLLHLILETVL